MKKKTLRFVPVWCLFFFVLGNCSLLKPRFDPVGHEYAVTIQKETLTLMTRARESFFLHREAVYRLMTHVERAYEHARLRYKNKGITGIWNVMRSRKSNRLARFMLEWEKEDILDEKYIEDAIKWQKKDFELLIKMEEGKKK